MDDQQSNYAAYMAKRRAQLEEEDWPFWLFHADPDCCAEHQELDGLPLSPQHPFWRTYFPPLDKACSCYVSGARSERGIVRLGGIPGKPVPDWCKC